MTIPSIIYNPETQKNEITIELNDSYLNSATKLSIARTILHELIHAYLLYAGLMGTDGTLNSSLQSYGTSMGLYSNDFHHGFMPIYISSIGYSLAEWNIRNGNSIISDRNYYDQIAWGGLSAKKFENGQYIWFDAFSSKFPSENQRREVHQKIINENKGHHDAEGRPC